MSPLRLICAAALAAALASPAFAAPGDETMTAPAEGAVNAPAAGTDTSATVSGSTTVTSPSGEVVVLRSSPTPVADAYRLKAGDPNVVSNAPIPDTVENRRAYGQPMSNGGRATPPAGN